ncbi:hypothetical protein VPH35_098897 [Triticum aestivum]
MELVELRTTSLAEAMFDKLGLPKPVYYVRLLEQGGYRSQIEFHHTKERYDASAPRTKLFSHICVSGEAAMDHAADLAIGYMESYGRKVLRNQTIKQVTREASNYLEEVHVASNKIHTLADAALDPAAGLSLSTLKQAILQIQNAIVALQSTTAAARISLEEKGIYSEDNVPEPVYDGLSDEETNEDYH